MLRRFIGGFIFIRLSDAHPLGYFPIVLTLERDVHAELVEQNRRRQLWVDEAARRGMERRERLIFCTRSTKDLQIVCAQFWKRR